MTPHEHRLLRIGAFTIAALLIAILPWLRRRTHPLRWAAEGAKDVLQPMEEAAVELLGLDAHELTPADIVADAAVVAIGVAEAVEHRHSRR